MADDSTPQLSPGAAALLKRSKAVVQPEKTDTPAPTPASTQLSPGAAELMKRSKAVITPDQPAAPTASAQGQGDDYPYLAKQGAFQGSAGMAGLPGLIAPAIEKIAGPGHLHDPVPPAGSTWNPLNPDFWSQGLRLPPTPADILGAAKNVGYDTNDLQPKSLGGEIVKGAAAATPSLALGAVTGLPAWSNALYTYGPALAGDLLHHYTGWNPAWAALPTALTLSGAEREIGNLWEKFAAPRAAAEAEAASRAFKETKPDVGLDIKRQKAAATGQAEQQRATAVEQAEQQKAAAVEQAGQQKTLNIADLQKRHDSEHIAATADREAVASSLGQSQTIQEAGGKLQDAARSWKENEFPKQLKKAEDDMYNGTVSIDKDAMGDLSNFRGVLKHSFYGAGTLEPAAKELRSRMPERLEDALDAIGKKQGLKPGEVPEATLDDMRNLRSILGDAMTSPKLTEGVDAGKMGELYRALSNDMEKTIINDAGPAGALQFRKFNEEAKRLYGLASGPVSDLISTVDKTAEKITPTDAVGRMGLDGTKLAQLRAEPTLGKGLDEVAAAKLRMGEGMKKDPGDPDQFVKSLSPEARTALFGDPNVDKLAGTFKQREDADAALKKWTDEMSKREQKAVAKAGEEKDKAVDVARAEKQKAVDVAGEERDRARIALGKEGQKLSQTAADTAARARELKYPPQPSGQYMPPWLAKMAGGVLSGYGSHQLTGAELPNLLNPLTIGAGAAGWLATRGAQELIQNPASIRNMLVGGSAVTPFNRGPGGRP